MAQQEKPLWWRLYFDECYTEVARAIGYAGCLYRELWNKLKPVADRFGQQRVESATYFLVTFEGQRTCNPKPLAEVRLREEARKLCWQLLGPPPERLEEFHRPSAAPPPVGAARAKEGPPPVGAADATEEPPKPEEPQPKPKRKRKAK